MRIRPGLLPVIPVIAMLAIGAGPGAAAEPPPAAKGTPLGAAPDPASISTSLLPEDAARALVVRTCVVCHPAELVVSKKRTIETWDKLIAKMVDYGARADDGQQLQILTYFAKYFQGTDTSIGAPVPPRT